MLQRVVQELLNWIIVRKRCATSSSLTRPHPTAPKDTGQDIWSWARMQWMIVTSLVPCHALYVPQHVAVSLSERFLSIRLKKQSLHN